MQTAYSYDDIPHCASRFTGKERDTETGLDYFGARYYGSSMGRFLSPDEFTGGPVDAFGGDPTPPGPLPYADITNPQSLNKYSYTYNNPLRFTDPDGHCPECIGDLIELIAQNPEAVQATLDGVAKATAATEAAAEGGLHVAGSTVGAVVIGLTYLISPGSGGANNSNDTIQGVQQEQKQQQGQQPPQQQEKKQTGPPSPQNAEHTKNPSPSKWDDHTKKRPGTSPPPNYKPDRKYKQPKDDKKKDKEKPPYRRKDRD